MQPLSGQTIVFLPGIDGTGISFEPLRDLLLQEINVIVIQYPTDKLLDFDQTVQCAKDQIQSDQQDVIVIAESFSGPVAIALVGSGQLKAKCLILCSTFAKSPRPVLLKILDCLPLEWLIGLPFPRFLIKHVVEGGIEATDLFLAMWQRVKPLVPAKTLVHRLNVISQVDVRGWLPKLNIPCLYIQASSDRAVPASALFDFTETITDLRVKRINGPHFILQAQPHESLTAIQNFVSLIPVSPAEKAYGTADQNIRLQ
jgi:pimeloyl-ACP methyl ester carboxylesterase